MGVHIIRDTDENISALYCSTTGWAFGKVFEGDEDPQGFLDWLGEDPRHLSEPEFDSKYYAWKKTIEVSE